MKRSQAGSAGAAGPGSSRSGLPEATSASTENADATRRSGKVFLVGAGPGEAGLVTLRGIEVLQRADVVVCDRLVSGELLAHARRGARVIHVGKTPGRHVVTQEEISRLTVREALSGSTVVRLKGGDPFIFGRGGEEALELAGAGVDFEVVPGVTAGAAAAAYAGIPLTHRAVASAVTLVTGHEAADGEGNAVDWHALASSGGTIVVYMGVAKLGEIAREIGAVRGRDVACALVERATTARQRTVVGTLGTISDLAVGQGIRPPAVLIVGDVVKLREHVSWFEKLPLSGKRVLIPRRRSQAAALARGIRALGGWPVVVPAIEIVRVDAPSRMDEVFGRLERYEWVLFTSANAVEVFWERLGERGLDARALGGVRVGVVGPATQASLAERGVMADFVPTEALVESLACRLPEAHPVEGKSVLIPRARSVGDALVRELTRRGARVEQVEIYEAVPCRASRTEMVGALDEGVDAVLYTSRSVVRAVVELAGGCGLAALRKAASISIGPVTSRALAEAGLDVAAEAKEHDADGLLGTLMEYMSGREGQQ